MSNQLLASLDFGRYQRWFDRTVGCDAALAVVGLDGEMLWDGNGRAPATFGKELVAAAVPAAGLQRLWLGADKIALYLPVTSAIGGTTGWVAAIVESFDQHAAPLSVDRVAELMEDLAAAFGDECSQKGDLEEMTEELGARYEELHLVYAVDQHIKVSGNIDDDVFQKLLQSAADHLNVDVVAFVRPSREACQYATSLSKELLNLDLVLVEMRGDLYRFVQASGETIVINAASDPRRAYIFTDMPYKIMACPVLAERRVDSLLVLVNHDHKPDFTNSDRKLAEILASQLSSLNNTLQMLESMREFNQQLARTLVEAVEAKDPYTRGHSERVHHISMEIGRAMGLPADELADLHWGSLLHDVGKIGIPDAVLCKPSRLTKDEYTFIKVHPERSYEILRHVKHLDRAVLGARHHQEMYDGKGYPHGLKGEHIPLHGRIIAVADTYDSITSSRAYRAGRSHEVAMNEIERVSGTQLDPAIVEIFKRVAAAEPVWLKHFNIRREKG